MLTEHVRYSEKEQAIETHEALFKRVHFSEESEAVSSEDSVKNVNKDEVNRLKRDVRKYREALHRQRQRSEGILPGQMGNHVILNSFKAGSEEYVEELSEKEHQHSRRNFMDHFIISYDSTYLIVWRVVHTLACLCSCYLYAWLTAFGVPSSGSPARYVDVAFEALFLLSLLLEFLTSYRPQSGDQEVREFAKISQRYLQGNFVPDLIPLVPLHWWFQFDNGNEKYFMLIKIVRLYRGLSLFRVRNIKDVIKNYFRWRMNTVLQDKDKANQKVVDYNQINE